MSVKMSLENLLKEIDGLKLTAEVDPSIGPASTLQGRIGIKRQAVERISNLKIEYQRTLKDSSFFIVATGSARNAFAEEVSSPEYKGFAIDPDQLYKDLIATINPKLFGLERTSYLFNAVGDALYSRAQLMDVRGYNALQFKEKYSAYVKTPEELLPVIRTAIIDQVGSEIVGIDALYRVTEKAIERGHTASATPILFNVSDEAYALDLATNLGRLTSKVFLVAAGKVSKQVSTTSNGNFVHVKTVNKETVEQVFNTIYSKLF